MFQILNPLIVKDSTCRKAISSFGRYKYRTDYYDKDGYELTPLEQSYYKEQGWPIDIEILYNFAWQEKWIDYKGDDPFILHHAMILHRCNYADDAQAQLTTAINVNPEVLYLLQSKQKWGIDFSLDFHDYDRNRIDEIIHIEYDYYVFDEFITMKAELEQFILQTDWYDAYKQIDQKRDEWSSLRGFEQNDWKARFFGFEKAEKVQKSV